MRVVGSLHCPKARKGVLGLVMGRRPGTLEDRVVGLGVAVGQPRKTVVYEFGPVLKSNLLFGRPVEDLQGLRQRSLVVSMLQIEQYVVYTSELIVVLVLVFVGMEWKVPRLVRLRGDFLQVRQG